MQHHRYSSLLTPALCPPSVPARSSVPINPESDARYGSFDFRAAHAEADADLQALLHPCPFGAVVRVPCGLCAVYRQFMC